MLQNKIFLFVPLTLMLMLGCGSESRSGADGGLNPPGNNGNNGNETSDNTNGSGDGNGDGDGDGDGDDRGIRLDLGEIPDSTGNGDGEELIGNDFSFIWIANSEQGTVSKINTRTGVEEGRYWTHPSQSPTSDPSRTSVNLLGDVAVSNRGRASTTAIAAINERCKDANNNGTIDTSQGANNILDWGSDECVLWHHPFTDASSDGSFGPRPTQWEGGTNPDDPQTVDQNPRVWIGYGDSNGGAQFVRLDGATGTELDRASIQNWTATMGPYGGVVNADGDLWTIGMIADNLYFIDAETLEVTNHGSPGIALYGLAIDADGNPWIAGIDGLAAVFDAETRDWTTIAVPSAGSLRGIQIDRNGRAWAAANTPCGLIEFDVASRSAVGSIHPLPGCITPVGVSIDIDGYVWSPDRDNDTAYKFNPDTHEMELQVTGLVTPYTYSDMTGGGLALVVNPPPQG